MLIGSQACMNCKFFNMVPAPPNQPQDQQLGECRRFPPVTDNILIGMTKDGIPQFQRIVSPNMTSPTQWCGEYVFKVAL
jgi:hypothetical protein